MKRSGITLIELLVSLTIIAILLAILIPSMQNAKQHSKAVLCQSNIRELTMILLTYEMENQTFPIGYEYTQVSSPGGVLGHTVAGYDRTGLWWINYISDYSKMDENRKTIFKCPAKSLTDMQLKNNVLYGNYGVNLSVCKITSARKDIWEEFVSEKPLNSGSIPHPSGTLLIADSGYSLISWKHVSDKDIDDLGSSIIGGKINGEDTSYIPGLKINNQRIGKSLFSDQEEDAVNGRHPQKGVNVGFVDGHVERKKADALLVEKTDAGYNNRCPLWQPE